MDYQDFLEKFFHCNIAVEDSQSEHEDVDGGLRVSVDGVTLHFLPRGVWGGAIARVHLDWRDQSRNCRQLAAALLKVAEMEEEEADEA